MPNKITIKEASIEDVVSVNSTITEFGKPYKKEYFEEKCTKKDNLIIVAYINNNSVGYIVWYNRDNDGSFYCWMAGVDPKYRQLGVLKKLMNYGFKRAQNKGYKKIKIKTRNNRREMLAYLIKHDFWITRVIQFSDISDNRIEFEKSI
jgi:ribosomal protein S18 acetylase RimI-like enzyme